MDGRVLFNISLRANGLKSKSTWIEAPSDPNIKKLPLPAKSKGTVHTGVMAEAVSIKANSSRLLQGGHLAALLVQPNQWLELQPTIK